jgi:hypothetical protein
MPVLGKAVHAGLWVLIAIATIIALAVCSFLFVFPLCANRVLEERTSPDGNFVAMTFERDCGATTDYATFLSIRKATEGVKFEGEVLTIDGKVPVSLVWTGDRTLKATIPQAANVVHEEQERLGVSVEYDRSR